MISLASIRYCAVRLALDTVGRLSDGIRLGLETGFDSGTMVDYVYRDEPHGVTPLGVFADRVFLSHPVWQGVRARRRLLVVHLEAALARYERPSLFDVAAGPGSYLFALPRNGAAYWAGDFKADEASKGRARATREGRDDVRFVQSDAFDPASWPIQHPDVLVTSGFFDILVEDADVDRLLDAGTRATQEGARWVFTAMERHTDTALLANTMKDFHGKPWEVRLRTAESIAARASKRGWEMEDVSREPHGFFAVATLRRVR